MAAEKCIPCKGHEESNIATPLTEFCYQLGSFNMMSEPGIADLASTQKEAALLMGLSAPRKLTKAEKEEFVSASPTFVVPRPFTFTCPSLSLEPLQKVPSGTTSRRVSNEREPLGGELSFSPPAELLGRTLKVDDRDALRLSADAMGRNVLSSFQQAMRWRVNQWERQLCASLATQESNLRKNGSTTEEVKYLVKSPEAKVLMSLKNTKIEVLSAGTGFRVIKTDVNSHGNKRQRTSYSTSAHIQKSVHEMIMDCEVFFDTPIGHSEVSLEVPGTMTCSTLCSRSSEELVSVEVSIDTSIFSAMMERACRKVVRASVEHILETIPPSNEKEDIPTTTKTIAPISFASPTTREVTRDDTNLVTPKTSGDSDSEVASNPVVTPCMLQLPDSFTEGPRRISPQPGSPKFPHLQPRSSLPSQTSLPPCLVSPPAGNNHSDEEIYREAGSSSPSLPLLVEAACRVMKTK